MLVAIRVDASLTIGTGHCFRMLTLATYLQKQQHQVIFVCREISGNLISLINKQFTVLSLPCALNENTLNNSHSTHGNWLTVPYLQEMADTKQILNQYLVHHNIHAFDWIVVDHYAIEQQWHQTMMSLTTHIMQVDDLADRQYQCRLLVDQNYYLNGQQRYKHLLLPETTTLLGPEFALLRDEFSTQRQQLAPYSERLKNKQIVVFFGGIDKDNETEKALIGLLKAQTNDHFNVIIGKNNPHRARLTTLCQQHAEQVTLHIQVTNMMEFLADAYLYVGAAGATTWERCSLGLPAIISTLAQNQVQLADDLATINGHFFIGAHQTLNSYDYQLAYQQLVTTKEALKLQSKQCTALVDGCGCQKVVNTMENISKYELL